MRIKFTREMFADETTYRLAEQANAEENQVQLHDPGHFGPTGIGDPGQPQRRYATPKN